MDLAGWLSVWILEDPPWVCVKAKVEHQSLFSFIFLPNLMIFQSEWEKLEEKKAHFNFPFNPLFGRFR